MELKEKQNGYYDNNGVNGSINSGYIATESPYEHGIKGIKFLNAAEKKLEGTTYNPC